MAPSLRKPRAGPGAYLLPGVLAAALLLLIGGVGYFIAGQVVAERHFQAAQRALERRDLAAARDHLARCLEVRRDSTDAHFLAARTARRTGAYDDAERHLGEYQRLGGVRELIDLERSLAHAQRGDLDRLESYLLACATQGHPDAVLILEALVKGYVRTYRMPQAEHCLKLWLKREPDNVQALVWRAEAAERRRNNTEALEDYRRAVALDPDHDDARRALAGLLVHAHRAAEAVVHYEHLRQRQPAHPAVLLGLARCRRDLGKPEEARELLDAALAADPGNAAALHERGRVAVQLDQLEDAEKWLRRAVAAAPYDRETVYTLYHCLQLRGKNEDAKPYVTRLEQIEAGLQRLAELTKKIAESPRDPEPRYEAGLVFLKNGQDVEGLRWLESALQEDARHRPTHRALAEYHERRGRPDLAEHHRRMSR